MRRAFVIGIGAVLSLSANAHRTRPGGSRRQQSGPLGRAAATGVSVFGQFADQQAYELQAFDPDADGDDSVDFFDVVAFLEAVQQSGG